MKRLCIICGGAALVSWTALLLAGRPMADALGQRFGTALLKLGEGKFSSAAEFIHRRFSEAAWLITLLAGWALTHGIVHFLFSKRGSCRAAWVLHAALAFVILNLWMTAAARTAGFWIAHWDGALTQNLTRFQVKMILAREQAAGGRMALVGSSQTRAQIDEAVLNGSFGPMVRVTDLAYPGAKALDVLLMQRQIDSTEPDYVVWYVSEAVCYSGSASEVIPNFLTLSQVPDLIRRDATRFISPEYLGSGILGAALPVFRLREVVTQRILGPQIGNLNQSRYDAALEANLSTRAKEAADYYRLNEESRMHERAMEDFIRQSAAQRQKVVLLVGQLHPTFQSALHPSIRPHMIAYLREIQSRHPNVILIEDIPPQVESDYDDLTHVNRAAQQRFSTFLAARLEKVLAETNASSR
jgi:hypothetical protein